MLTKTKKTNIVKKLGKTDKDTGSPEVQVGILTKRIDELSKHLKVNKKDFHTSGTIIKLTMLTGICFLFLLKYLLSK
jgi:small subunit ribosomal protein S15